MKKSVKDIVKEKYSEIANQVESENCCSPSSCCSSNKSRCTAMNDNYKELDGYVPEADLQLGCGVPTIYAGIKEGNVVVDLGSGAGNDAFIARSLVGESGKVIGIDMTEKMIQKAKLNNSKLDYNNVEFRLGDIENIPLTNNSTDVVLSNCVLNLVPDKKKVFAETHRILKKGGHFCISDIVTKGILPEKLKESAELYTGCIAGAIDEDEYLRIISDAGFSNVEVKVSKKIPLPEEILANYFSQDEIIPFKNNEVGIFSITVVGYKI
ncbi:arsenite methyltransferase [Stygiobacter electus]|uniref:Arsenite methyltransferase n=1 Tax=Stygiobacter electus TaxID=3032292 RepID=A0AAE3P4K1_9BACT|nr:arsenite methyltransferase [Stygiobacter electus]MDF1612850.1 arsenite methyltransferase [Stygiobacter electus]